MQINGMDIEPFTSIVLMARMERTYMRKPEQKSKNLENTVAIPAFTIYMRNAKRVSKQQKTKQILMQNSQVDILQIWQYVRATMSKEIN